MLRTEISPLMQELSAYVSTSIRKRLPPEISNRAKVHLIDTVAAMVSGSHLPPGRKAIAYVRTQGGKPEAFVVGSRIITSAPNAALANGMCGHADETDDHIAAIRLHPGTCIIPAVLAIADRQQLSGEQVLRAIVLGYDISARLLLALKLVSLDRPEHHGGAIGGGVGATAACAALLKLNAQKIRYALSYSAQNAAGLYTWVRDPHHIEKAYVLGGMPAHNGVAAALMVAHGFTGVEDVFSGEPDFLSIFSRNPDRAQLTKGLGQDYKILCSSIKRWAVGAPIQAPLQVLHELIQQHDLKAADVKKLLVRMPNKQLPVVNNRDIPDICVQHLLAVMLLDGIVSYRSAHDYARMKDPKVLAVRKRVETVGDPELDDPLRRWRCAMEITLMDGRKLTQQTMAAKGWFENPITHGEVEEKSLDLIAPVLGKLRAQALMAAVWNFDRIRNVRSLRELFCA